MKERKFVKEAVNKLLVAEFIRKATDNAGFGGIEMKRTPPFGTNITLYVNKPGLVIGRHGAKVQEITDELERRFKVESPQIEVKEIPNPDLNPQVVSKKIALSLEKGWNYRKAGNTSLRRVIEAGSKGVMIRIGGARYPAKGPGHRSSCTVDKVLRRTRQERHGDGLLHSKAQARRDRRHGPHAEERLQAARCDKRRGGAPKAGSKGGSVTRWS